MKNQLEKEKELAALAAVQYVRDGQVVGLGTGSSSEYAIRALGEMVKNGLRITGVPTSIRTAQLAEALGIPLADINTINEIDITIDGADEFTTDLLLIKGGGGALLREKIVASLTKQQIIIADSSKLVEKLGKFHLPIEVIPFASNYVLNQLKKIGGQAKIRQSGAEPYKTDQGNYILDTDFGLMENPRGLAENLNRIEGIACYGLFIDLAERVIMAKGDETFEFTRA